MLLRLKLRLYHKPRAPVYIRDNNMLPEASSEAKRSLWDGHMFHASCTVRCASGYSKRRMIIPVEARSEAKEVKKGVEDLFK